MPREKNNRNLTFKPTFKNFIPEDIKVNGTTHLLAEEMEALYLMDTLEVYQEEAALSMEVSRPTFTRILKSARRKLTNALISGHKIVIDENNAKYNIAVCSNNDTIDEFVTILPSAKYILVFSIENKEMKLIKTINNPVYDSDDKPAIVLPEIFLENKINIFISSKIGEGLKNSLISKGIQPIIKDSFKIDDCLNY